MSVCSKGDNQRNNSNKTLCFKIYLQYQGIFNTINTYCLPIQNVVAVLHFQSTFKKDITQMNIHKALRYF